MSWDGTLQRQRLNTPFRHLMKATRHDPTIGFFWCLVCLHVLFWTILAAFTQPNLPAVSLDMLASGREFSWGYASHPPLGVWLATTVNALFAPANWPVYMLAQLCGVVSVWSAWKFARKFLHPWTALCGAFVLLGGYSCTIAASSFSGDLLAGAFWSLSIYLFHSALTKDRRRYWAATGICLACGFLSSYGTFLLLLTMFIFTLVDDRARRCWDSSWPFLAGMAMLAMLMPHFLWLARHQFLTVQAGIERSASVTHHLIEPLSYLGTQLLCVIPVVVLLTPLVAWFSFEEPARSEEDDREFARRYLLWMTCLPPAVTFGLALVAGPSSGLFAGVTNWSFLGVAVLMWGHLNETRTSWRRSIIRIGSAVGLFAAALIALNLMVPQIQRQGVATQFPGEELSRQIESLWARFGYSGDAPIVAGPSHLVSNATWYSSNNSVSYSDFNPLKNPGVNDSRLKREGGVIVWELDGAEKVNEVELQKRFGQVSMVSPVDFRWKMDSTLPAVRVGMAIVHPESANVATTVVPAENTTIPNNIQNPAQNSVQNNGMQAQDNHVQFQMPFRSMDPVFGKTPPTYASPEQQANQAPVQFSGDYQYLNPTPAAASTTSSQTNRSSTTLPSNYPAANYPAVDLSTVPNYPIAPTSPSTSPGIPGSPFGAQPNYSNAPIQQPESTPATLTPQLDRSGFTEQ